MKDRYKDYLTRMSELSKEARKILDNDESSLNDYSAFFNYHDETKSDFLSEYGEEEEKDGFFEIFDSLPELCEQHNRNNSFFMKIICFFVKRYCPKLKAKKLLQSVIETYDNTITSLNKIGESA